MINLRFIRPLACVAAIGCLMLGACDKTPKEEENASVVNIEKGVAPAVANPEGSSSHQSDVQPAGLTVHPIDEDDAKKADKADTTAVNTPEE